MARQRSDERPKSRAKTLPEKQLSPSEWRIMQSCWKLGRTTIRDILLDIADRPPAMSYTTVHMLLTRIVEKGYLALEQDRGNNYYAAAVERDSIVRLAAEDFVDNILAGEAKNLEILNEVLAERKVKRPRGRKAT
ncbi:MAG: BlaI/MecI/CopY family transcriptional regulator [Hyphomicrobiaceae bacterium]|nr:MAG: BlaI/MecI/CopY family transcriptional regulator [Hyphomicrobiaceae bacterium]